MLLNKKNIIIEYLLYQIMTFFKTNLINDSKSV